MKHSDPQSTLFQQARPTTIPVKPNAADQKAAVAAMVREDLAAKGIRIGPMEDATAHADRETPGWSTTAEKFLLAFAGRGKPFIAEDVVAAARLDPTFPAPPDERAWGSVFNAASRRGQIVKVGFKARNQGNPCVEWAGGNT